MDPISDMFTRIKNAQAVSKETVIIPYSKLKMKILEIFLRENFIKEINRKGKKNKKIIEIVLAYNEDGSGCINNIIKVSKLSKRIYLPSKKINIISGRLIVISTSKGVLGAKEAIKQGVGGEIICKVY